MRRTLRRDHAIVDVVHLQESRIAGDDPGPTLVIEPVGKEQKACDVKKELADDAALKAKMMQRISGFVEVGRGSYGSIVRRTLSQSEELGGENG